MNIRTIAIVALAAGILSLAGCATANYTAGRDFTQESVSQIIKGKTTGEELTALMGQPDAKAVMSATEEKWTYQYINTTSSAQSYVVSMSVETTGIRKLLDVLIKDGVVINYAYTEGPIPGMTIR
jgi:outer membrane protein assembly factor BamE (lipoprotein component of BamABCDE complex)